MDSSDSITSNFNDEQDAISAAFKRSQIKRLATIMGAKRVSALLYPVVQKVFRENVDYIAYYSIMLANILRVKTISYNIVAYILTALGHPVPTEAELEEFAQACPVQIDDKNKGQALKCHVFNRTPIVNIFKAQFDRLTGREVYRISDKAKLLLHKAIESQGKIILENAVQFATVAKVDTITPEHFQHAYLTYHMARQGTNYPQVNIKKYETFIKKIWTSMKGEKQTSGGYISHLDATVNRIINRIAVLANIATAYFPNASKVNKLEVAMAASMPRSIYLLAYKVGARIWHSNQDDDKVPSLTIPMNRLNNHYKLFTGFGLGRFGYIMLDSLLNTVITEVVKQSIELAGTRKRLTTDDARQAVSQVLS